jgi:O-antigen ligase
MNREKLDDFCEKGILGLVLAILVFGPLAFGGARPIPLLVIEGLAVGVMLLWAARFWSAARPRLLWPPICWLVLAFTLYAVGRYFTADIEYVARQELIQVLLCAFLFLAVLNNLHRQEYTQIVSYTLVFLAMLISCYAIFQFLTGSDRVWHLVKPYPHRGSGTYICPNHLGGFLEMVLPLGLAYTISSRLKPTFKVFLGYASFVIMVGLGASLSRGAWIATVLALGLFFSLLLLHRSHRLSAVLFLGLILMGGAIFIPRSELFKARIGQLYSDGKLDDDKRFELWGPALLVWRENPWWGAGPAHFDYRFRQYRPETVQLRPDRTHNDFLNVLTDLGIVGAVLISAAWVLLFAGVIKTWGFVRGSASDLAAKRSNKYAFVLGASAGLIAILLHSAVDFNFHIPANAILAVTLMALVSAHLRHATERFWFTPATWLKAVASLVLVAGAAFFTMQVGRQARECVWLERARVAPSFSPAQIACLTNAFAVEPMNAATAHAIGEAYRVESAEGGANYTELATNAMRWFECSRALNPWDGYNYLRYGWCLDWLGHHAESATYFEKAVLLDPNGYFTLNGIGQHYMELGKYAAARPWFERSARLQWKDNPIAQQYLEVANARLLEAATNDLRGRLLRALPSVPPGTPARTEPAKPTPSTDDDAGDFPP